MTDLKQTRSFWEAQVADENWSRIGQATFGKRWGDVRYTAAGKGEPGSALRQAHDAYEKAREAWRATYNNGKALEQND
jgi:hypothetical protein